MPVKVFVGRLAEGTSRDDLTSLFKKYGDIVECDVISNYGFVHMNSLDEANAAIAALDGHNIKGSNIHVELSTAKTQGRKKRMDSRGPGPSRGGMTRYEPYPSPAVYPNDPPRNMGPLAPDHQTLPPHREEYASEQVKDLLELYFRDPIAFDQYAKTYYYGERMERMARLNKHPSEYYPAPPPANARRFV